MGLYAVRWRPVLWIVIQALLSVGLALMVWWGINSHWVRIPADAAGQPANSVVLSGLLVYYANETPDGILATENYLRLLSALEQSTSALSKQVLKSVRRDAEVFPKLVARETDIILKSAAANGFSALVFTNSLARRLEYIYFDAARNDIRRERFPALPPPVSAMLEFTPLSREEALRAVLATIAGVAGSRQKDVVLITKTHGDNLVALMPRVFADLSRTRLEKVLTYLDEPPRLGELPWEQYHGVSKQLYWSLLRDAGQLHGLQFGLVFREACMSGVTSFSEYRTVPGNVRLIAHTGEHGLSYGEVDYSALFSKLSTTEPLSTQLATRLRLQHISVESMGNLTLDLILRLLATMIPALLLIPLAVWLYWNFRRGSSRLWSSLDRSSRSANK